MHRRGSRRARVLPLALALALLAAACRLPELEQQELEAPPLPQTSVVYAADGRVLTRLHAEQDRVLVPIERIAPAVRDAVVAIEDARFYDHRGVDARAIMRAIYVNATEGRIVEGGSTITQQYVKNTLVGAEPTLNRKLREARLAYQLEQRYSKDEILEKYLNTVYFGGGAYGIQTAARHYFSRSARDLTLAQAALLAGLIAAPTNFDPLRYPELARARRNVVLARMREQGYITRQEQVRAASEGLGLRPAVDRDRYPAAHFVDHVRRLIVGNRAFGETREEREKLLYTGGLRIHTTLDLRLQSAAEEAVEGVLPFPNDPYAAMTVIDPRNGHVVAMVGGRDFFSRKDPVAKVNLATGAGGAGRQGGSAFKTFALVAALAHGIPPSRVYDGARAVIPTPGSPHGDWWIPENYDGTAYGPVTLEQATIDSVNVAYAHLVRDLGGGDPFRGARIVNDTARAMGIGSRLDDVPSTVLGANGVSTLEMASAYGTLATMGRHVAPLAITKVADASGTVLWRARREPQQVLNPAVAWVSTQILQKVVQLGTGTAANIGRPAAGKTGTGQEWRNAWFVGYVPQLVAAVWVGFPKEQRKMTATRIGRVTGGSWPTQIWHAFMTKATRGMPPMDFPRPQFGYVSVRLDATRGCLPNRFTPPTVIRVVRYPAGTQPREVCSEPTEPQLLPVPSVVGLPLEEAQAALESAGFTATVGEQYSKGSVPGVVLTQDPPGGAEAYMGTAIALVVATDRKPEPSPRPKVEVPDVVGMPRQKAVATLEEGGFEVKVVEAACEGDDCDATPGTVWDQAPGPGEKAARGSTVRLWSNPPKR